MGSLENWTFFLDVICISPLIAIQYIMNNFSSNFVWHKSYDTQYCKKFAKYSYCQIFLVKVFPVSTWKFNSGRKKSSGKQFYSFNIFEITVLLQCLSFRLLDFGSLSFCSKKMILIFPVKSEKWRLIFFVFFHPRIIRFKFSWIL